MRVYLKGLQRAINFTFCIHSFRIELLFSGPICVQTNICAVCLRLLFFHVRPMFESIVQKGLDYCLDLNSILFMIGTC